MVLQSRGEKRVHVMPEAKWEFTGRSLQFDIANPMAAATDRWLLRSGSDGKSSGVVQC